MYKGKWFWSCMCWTVCGLFTVMAVAGCSPSEPTSSTPSNQLGHSVDALQAWKSILGSAEGGEASGRYMVSMNVDVSDSSSHSQMIVYGGINPVDTGSIDIVESNKDVKFYQQGQVAYYKDNGRWTQTTPLADLDVFPTYIHLIQYASAKALPVVQLHDTYVNSEYCTVYRAIFPSSALDTLPILGRSVSKQGLKDIQYTFYVGQTDKLLREVQTRSVGDLTGIGSMQVVSDTVLFDIGQKVATVQLPLDLVKQLENTGT